MRVTFCSVDAPNPLDSFNERYSLCKAARKRRRVQIRLHRVGIEKIKKVRKLDANKEYIYNSYGMLPNRKNLLKHI